VSKRVVRLHLFGSVKGGVGKSTLATAAAKLLALKGQKPAFVDCDLSGTSIADGLRLRAPDVPMTEGLLDVLAEPTGRHLSVDDTEKLRRRRGVLRAEDDPTKDGPTKDRPYPPAFLNDALNYAYLVRRSDLDLPKSPRTDALVWIHEKEDGVLYLPSSSILEDVQGSMGWFMDEPYDFAYSLMICVDALLEHRQELTDIILDLPPGLYGFPFEALMIAQNIEAQVRFPEGFPQWVGGPIEWQVNPFMVTSQDPNDFRPALEYVARHRDDLPSLHALINKRTRPFDEIKTRAREKLGPMLAHAGIEETKLKEIGFVEAFATLFLDGDVEPKAIPEGLMQALRLVKS